MPSPMAAATRASGNRASPRSASMALAAAARSGALSTSVPSRSNATARAFARRSAIRPVFGSGIRLEVQLALERIARLGLAPFEGERRDRAFHHALPEAAPRARVRE